MKYTIKKTALLTPLLVLILTLGGCGKHEDDNNGTLAISELEPAEPLSKAAQKLPSAAQIPPRPEDVSGPLLALNWDDLIPEGYNPQQMMVDAGLMEMSDFDPRAQNILDELREEWDTAPLIEELHGREVELSGYVVPTEGFAQRGEVTEFLLVPYHGACIHVPPPPANQTVYVLADKPIEIPELFAIVTVTGVMVTERVGSDLAAAGYVIHADDIVIFDPRDL